MGKPISLFHTFKDGSTIELFYIGTLANRLGRVSNTIRKWEIAGILPKTGFTDKMGCRLYSQEQIDVIVKTAEEAKISTGRSIFATSFPKVVAERFNVLLDKYKLKDEVYDDETEQE